MLGRPHTGLGNRQSVRTNTPRNSPFWFSVKAASGSAAIDFDRIVLTFR